MAFINFQHFVSSSPFHVVNLFIHDKLECNEQLYIKIKQHNSIAKADNDIYFLPFPCYVTVPL